MNCFVDLFGKLVLMSFFAWLLVLGVALSGAFVYGVIKKPQQLQEFLRPRQLRCPKCGEGTGRERGHQ